ncbi:MAG: coenzyme F420-0:L-glutamate ligase [Candidatus Roizmanbacteria bacterium]|nr:MAG: coenzyme F420-0:L-glutamate ligase [Candidatus Roizmanbacteria bacterium]
MKVTPVKTYKITRKDNDVFKILDKYITHLPEKSVVAVTSKIVSICEGRIVKKSSEEQKNNLAKKEAEYYLPREFNQYGFMISINRGIMVASAGIDESNGQGYLVLWPKDPQKSANSIREYLAKKFKLNHVGIIITDSKLTPLRWGVTGVAIAHSGFRAINSYIGKPDIFGRLMHAEKVNVADALATAAVLEMGEGNEQQPLAIIENIGNIRFQKRNPTKKELDSIKIAIGDDVFSSLLTSVQWQKGNKK